MGDPPVEFHSMGGTLVASRVIIYLLNKIISTYEVEIQYKRDFYHFLIYIFYSVHTRRLRTAQFPYGRALGSGTEAHLGPDPAWTPQL